MRLPTVILAAFSFALLGACATDSGSGHGEASKGSVQDLRIAREHAYTRLLEIRVDDDAQLTGYLVEFDELPVGVVDERTYPVGTVLVQDVALETVGFLTPGGEAFRFDEEGRSHSLGHGTRHQLIASILGSSPNLRFRAIGASH